MEDDKSEATVDADNSTECKNKDRGAGKCRCRVPFLSLQKTSFGAIINIRKRRKVNVNTAVKTAVVKRGNINTVESDIRISVFLWLKEQSNFNGGVFDRKELEAGIQYKGSRITLMGPSGIWTPKGFDIPLSLTTTHNGPYQDGFNQDGFLEYKYRGGNPGHRDNIGLKKAYDTRTPLVYFHSIKPGKYVAVWPIFIYENDPYNLQIKAALDPAYSESGQILAAEPQQKNVQADSVLGIRKYVTALVRQRMHQSAFREFVLEAYSRQCTMCRLQHPELLDAAHIIPDSEPDGQPIIQNGLSLCKIHHAAYDKNIIGITPDYTIRVRDDILNEIDGPMLKYGLQSLNNTKIILPKSTENYPDRERLDVRYRQFIA